MQTAVKGLHRSCRVPEPGGESTEGHQEIAASAAEPSTPAGKPLQLPALLPLPCIHSPFIPHLALPRSADGHHGDPRTLHSTRMLPTAALSFCCLSFAVPIFWACTS